MATATAMAQSNILAVDKPEMVRQLHTQPAFADRFLTHMLTRNIRIEEDLVDQLFNSPRSGSHVRCCYWPGTAKPEASHRALPMLSQEVLAEMVGTTRSRVNFRKLGFIDYNGVLKVNNSLLGVVFARLTDIMLWRCSASAALSRRLNPVQPSLARLASKKEDDAASHYRPHAKPHSQHQHSAAVPQRTLRRCHAINGEMR